MKIDLNNITEFNTKIMIPNNIYSTTPISNGHSWSITSRLGNILNNIENNFGKRDISYIILGVELTDSKNPQVWFPGDCKHIVIQITEDCQTDMIQAIYQVAHEAVHCLNPVKNGEATVLEEGLATYFAAAYTNEAYPECKMTTNDSKYKRAEDLVRQLLNGRPMIIRHLRSIEPSLSKITKDLLLEIHPELDPEFAGQLTQPFANL